MNRASCLLPLLLLLASSGCEEPARKAPARVWTLFDLSAALEAGTPVVPRASDLLPGGFPATHFVRRPAAGGTAKELPIRLAFAEGKPAAYITTELWSHFPAVWVQPMYVLVTGWNAETNSWRPLARDGQTAKSIFSVGPRSGFYSPFWRVYYVKVSPDTPLDKYRSSRDVLADALEVHPGPGRLCALAPSDVALPADPKRPIYGDNIQPVGIGEGWVDGLDAPVRVVDFGTDRFTWNDRFEVDEQPLFVFFGRNANGAWVPTMMPNVGGTGPLFSRTAAMAPNNKPAFGSLWRLYAVKLPPNTKAILPEGVRAEVPDPASLEALGLDVHPVPFVPGTKPPEEMLKLTTRTDCMAPGAMPSACVWLDSQEKIEAELPTRIERTEILVTCPFVTYNDAAVPK